MQESVSRVIAWSPVLQVGVLSLGTLLCFLVAYFKGDVTEYLPFISENGAIIPELNFFSFTLIIGSVLGCIVVLFRYLTVANMICNDNKIAVKLNLLSLPAGVISMAGLAGVAAVPMSTVLILHLIAAGVHFGLAMVYLFMQTYLSFQMLPQYKNKALCKFRFGLSCLLLVFLTLLIVCMPIGYFGWKKRYPDRLHALKTPQDEGFGILFAAAFFEWFLYFTFMGFLLTFTIEFKKFELVLSVRQAKSNANDIETNGHRPENDTIDNKHEDVHSIEKF